MPKTVSSSEARENFGALLKWAKDNRDEIVVKLRGEPAAVIMSYGEYQEIAELRELRKRQNALTRLRAVRERVQQRVEECELSAEKAYALAGLEEEAAKNILDQDRHLADAN